MKYTKEFEEFLEAHNLRRSHSTEEYKTYRALSAFVRLVRKEMEDIKHEYDNPRCDILGEALERVCQKFGLEEK